MKINPRVSIRHSKAMFDYYFTERELPQLKLMTASVVRDSGFVTCVLDSHIYYTCNTRALRVSDRLQETVAASENQE